MNPVLANILATNQVIGPDGAYRPLHSYIPAFECQIMQQWLQEHGCSRLVEIGLAYGISALFLCDVLAPCDDITYHILDPYQQRDWAGIGLHNLTAAGYRERVQFHAEAADHCLPRLWQAGFRCDFALIDGDHTFAQVMNDFFSVNRLLIDGGLVVFDDIQLPTIQQVVAHVQADPTYSPLPLPKASQNSTIARARQLAGIPAARIVGFIKTQRHARMQNGKVS